MTNVPEPGRAERRRAFWTMIGHESAKAVITVLLIGGVAAVLYPYVNGRIDDAIKAQAAAVAACDHPQDLKLVDRIIATSSSEMTYTAGGNTFAYPARQLVDGSRDSAWVSADEKTLGVGSKIVLTLPRSEDVRLICVLNGFANGTNYKLNGSVRIMAVTTAQGERDAALPELTDANAFTYQPLAFAPGRTRTVEFVVKVADGARTYPPPPHVSATISEVELWVAR